jgi:nitrate/TMAO reductase-like tetraheme cytochrome c subunit
MGIRNFARRRKGVLIILGIVIVAGYIGANIIAYSLTYKPEACLVCHLMKPYYDNWKSSRHNKVGCIDCHPYRPSTIVMSSLRYLAGTYNLPLKSRVEDKECILCHRPDSIKRVVSFKGTPFNHLEHIQKVKRGKVLHCTSCHYSLVQSRTHMDVDQNVCILCHFFTTPPQYNQNCIVCHGQKRKEVKIGEVTFSHDSFLKTGARCVECHSQTVTGAGEAPEERCRECHIERKVEGRDATRLHEIHTSKNYINCFKCHNRIEHGKETLRFSKAIELSCNECHRAAHDSSKDMYMGMGAPAGVKDAPSAMYISRVQCIACHTLEKSIQGKQILSKSWEAKKKSCVVCHKPGYERMLEDWKKNMGAFTEALAKMVDQYGKVLEQRKASAGLMNEFRTIEHDLGFLKGARGEHNVQYAFDIGKNIVARVQEGYKKSGVTQKPALPPHIAKPDGYCMFCHSTYLPEKEVRIKALNLKFDHAQHVEMGTECTKCHDPKLHRTGVFKKEACKECHKDLKL